MHRFIPILLAATTLGLAGCKAIQIQSLTLTTTFQVPPANASSAASAAALHH